MSSDEVKNDQDDVASGDDEASAGAKAKHPKKRIQVKKKQATVNPDIEERVVAVNRVAKVVKGGRRFSFSALMIVGDKKGSVGFGLGKANEVPEAIRKAIQAAHRNMIKVSLDKGTIPHQIIGTHDAGRIIFKPAAEGTGIKAAGACRSILELAGVKNVLTKSVRNNNPHNVVKATFDALRALRSAEQIAAMRGIDIKRIRLK
ncbi:MAG TPA: 30S ribosomal protein S5 [Bdellovibrionales bacterium]|nr:30S ribosomal protein S5 [Bdellovibrionales bacterium]